MSKPTPERAAHDRMGADARMRRAVSPPSRDIGARELPDALSQDERDVLEAFAAGASKADVAASLEISEEMIDALVASVLAKLHRRNRSASTPPQPAGESTPGGGAAPPTNDGS